ncbi:calcium homeostasis modulator protein 6-like [Saccopteryx bilineata]|uniref:calcium homeostasis modulator protein 6-like n=1 Tax=Saccopteryx bilineata TaxID=59482 RepID=UPI00338E874E
MQKFLGLITRHHRALGYGLGTLLTAGGEPIFSTVLFQCPCSATWNLPYGLVLLLVPALLLFLLTYVIRARSWRPLTCCCARGDGTGSDTGGSGEPDARTCCGRERSGLQVWARLSGPAALAPLTWVAVALLGGAFYECGASGSGVVARFLCQGRDSSCMDQLPLVPCKKAPEPAVQDLLMELRAQSQIMGWMLIAAGIIFFLFITSVTRCQSPGNYMQWKFSKIYMEQEDKIFKREAPKHATKLAKRHVKYFFENADPKAKEGFTPTREDWQQISPTYSFNVKTKNQYYSLLHKYAYGNGRSHCNQSSEGDRVNPVLKFVDTPGLDTASGIDTTSCINTTCRGSTCTEV